MNGDRPPSYPFELAWSYAERAKGWLSREEAELLYRLSAAASRHGRVVELGSYCGRSSIVLAAALKDASSGSLVCVDTFRGSAEHQPGCRYFDAETLVDGVVNTYPTFSRNLEQAGLLERVEVMRLSTLAAAVGFSDSIGLLFVDADHDYEAIRADLQAWVPGIIQDGWIVVHDIGQWSGPTRAAADLLDAGFKRYAQSGTALALCKPAALLSDTNIMRKR
ncbi:MAG: class I SAM-dependent methyltransferase [Rhizobiales bacterium]|nr:class I SAM-dependent methyltransferase [Hyphomicrobiales bacterium]